jgi:hypothetical protein
MGRRRRLASGVVLMCGILRMRANRRGDNRRLLGRQGQATTDKEHHFRLTNKTIYLVSIN